MNDFFRFPHTQHLAWLGEGPPRDDKVLSPKEAGVTSVVVVESYGAGPEQVCVDGYSKGNYTRQ